MLEFTTGAVALGNAEFAFLLRTWVFLAYSMKTLCKEIAKEPEIANTSSRQTQVTSNI